MKKLSQEQLLTSLKAFVKDDKELIRIISYCKLQAINNDYKFWIDSDGNELKIHSPTHITINTNRSKNQYCDLYLKTFIAELLDRSRGCVLAKDDGEYFLWIFCHDLRIRYYIYQNAKWSNSLPPLFGGLNIMRQLVSALGSKCLKTFEPTITNGAELFPTYIPNELLNLPQFQDFLETM